MWKLSISRSRTIPHFGSKDSQIRTVSKSVEMSTLDSRRRLPKPPHRSRPFVYLAVVIVNRKRAR